MKKELLLSVLFCALGIGVLNAQVAPTVVAQGFNKGLIGIEIDAAGNIWATENGTGNDDGQITIVDPSGNKNLFMAGLPSTYIAAAGEVVGSYRTYQRPNNKVLIVVGEGSNLLSETLLIVDKSGYTPGNPLTLSSVEQTLQHGAFVHAQGFVQSNPFNIEWDAEGNIYTADAGANSIVKWDKNTGAFSIVKTIDRFPNPLPFGPPMIDPVPTGVLRKPDGSFFVSQLTGFPFIQGAANVYNLDAAGNMSVYASGFSCLTDLAFDPRDSNLCVLQFGVFGPVDSTLNFILGSAAVIKIYPDGSRDTLSQGIGGLSSSFTFDAAGNLYVTDLVFGQILKFDLTSNAPESAIVHTSVKAYPNPASEQVTIEFELRETAPVSLQLFDLNGRHVATLVQENTLAPGHYTARWNEPAAQPAGLYVYRLTAGASLASGWIQITK